MHQQMYQQQSHIHLNLSNLPQATKRGTHGSGGWGTAATPVSICIQKHRQAIDCGWDQGGDVRNDVSSSGNGLLAGLAVPDSDRVASNGGLAAECAYVSGVLCDFHLLDLLTEGSTVSVREEQSAPFQARVCSVPQLRRCWSIWRPSSSSRSLAPCPILPSSMIEYRTVGAIVSGGVGEG